MGKALRPEHLTFFTARMKEHDRVVNCVLIENKHEYLFKVRRKLSGSEEDVIVHLTDAYRYGRAEFYARPDELKAGSYVVIGMPHANAAAEVVEEAKEDRIGIGPVGKFMGALTQKNIWEYMSQEERQQKEREQQRSKSRR